MAQNTIQFHVKIPFSISFQDGVYESGCDVLDIYSQGDTKEEAANNLIEAVKLFIETSYTMGNLDNILHDCGFKPQPCTEESLESNQDYLDVPLPLLVANNAQNHAY